MGNLQRNSPWFSESNTDADWHGTLALTSERSVRLQVESSYSSTPESEASSPSAVTPARSSRELRPTEPPSFSQVEPPDDPRPSPEPTAVACLPTPSSDESPEPSSSRSRRSSSRS